MRDTPPRSDTVPSDRRNRRHDFSDCWRREHSEETIAVGEMRIGVRGEDGKKSETKLRSQDGTRLMTLGDGLLSRLPHLRPPIDLIIIINHLEQWNALDHISVVLGEREPTNTLLSHHLDRSWLGHSTLVIFLLSCSQTRKHSSLSHRKELFCSNHSAVTKMMLLLILYSGDLSLRGCTFTSLLDSAHSEDSSHVVDVTIGKGKDGGGLKVCVSGTGVIELSEVHFSKCSSSGNGGAVLIEVASLFAGTISFASVEFGTGDDKTQPRLERICS
ncbi:hypothetical protein BLNAU_23848 [Blattamonas nauphoetae]|uniref:Uncharacterized protein n=1 Tax=Blattamonas nauphoetae TaxID=2049346 RepID=A0ABQ9WQ16_9EUKA|nr:hypothetical protein BLNAU_23848 [Blattamonas nauphoetae]